MPPTRAFRPTPALEEALHAPQGSALRTDTVLERPAPITKPLDLPLRAYILRGFWLTGGDGPSDAVYEPAGVQAVVIAHDPLEAIAIADQDDELKDTCDVWRTHDQLPIDRPTLLFRDYPRD